MDINLHYSEFYKEVTKRQPQLYVMGNFRAFSFNGNPQNKSIEPYRTKLGELLSRLKDCLITQDESVLNRLLKELQLINYADYNVGDNITEDELSFVKSVIQIQKDAVDSTISYICSLLEIEEKVIVQSEKETEKEQKKKEDDTKNQNVISGIQGLADYMRIGKTKATELSKSKVFAEHGIRYTLEGKVFFFKDRLDEMLRTNPNILRGKLEKNI